MEEDVNASIDVNKSVIAPGGSAVYSDKAMRHFKEMGTMIYLKLDYQTVKTPPWEPQSKGGGARKRCRQVRDLYNERIPYYEKYADITVKLDKLSIGNSLEKVLENL